VPYDNLLLECFPGKGQKEGILFSGDLCVNWRIGNNVGDRDADHSHWVQALNDLARWNVKTRAGKTVDELLKDVDLSRHGNYAADFQQTQAAIRQVFKKAPG
jgi:hypothetical protein